MRLSLVPEGGAGDVVLEGEVALLTFQGGAPAEGLDRHPQILRETNGVHDVPPVQAEALLGAVEAVGADDLGEAEEGGGEDAVLAGGELEVPGAAEVVLGAGAADGRPVGVSVQVELDLALAPPAVVVDAPGEVGADVVALALHAAEQGMDLLVGE